jgi:hypothetical protein
MTLGCVKRIPTGGSLCWRTLPCQCFDLLDVFCGEPVFFGTCEDAPQIRSSGSAEVDHEIRVQLRDPSSGRLRVGLEPDIGQQLRQPVGQAVGSRRCTSAR